MKTALPPRLPPRLPMRLRKLIGVFVLLFWILAYTIFMVGLAARVLPLSNGWIQLAFYATAGLAWIVPVRYLFHWMSRPDPET